MHEEESESIILLPHTQQSAVCGLGEGAEQGNGKGVSVLGMWCLETHTEMYFQMKSGTADTFSELRLWRGQDFIEKINGIE